MVRKAPTIETVRALFARSGNQCAYPGCQHELMDSKTSKFVAQICHIHAAEFAGQRYDPSQSDEDRRSAANLLLLCYKHHILTDDVELFPPERLIDMKMKHEATYAESSWTADEATLQVIEAEEAKAWRVIGLLNESEDQKYGGVVLQIDTDLSVRDLLRSYDEDGRRFHDLLEMIASDYENLNEEIKNHLTSIGYDTEKWDQVPNFENPFFNKFWEATNIGFANFPIAMRSGIYQIALNYYFAAAKAEPGCARKQQELEEFRSYFEENFTSQVVVD